MSDATPATSDLMRLHHQHHTLSLLALVSLLAFSGCEQRAQQPDNTPRETSAATTETAEQPLGEAKTEAPEKEDDVHMLEGTIEKIRLQNINKMKGRYTYNVELRIRAKSITPEHQGTDINGNPIEVVTIRLGKLSWKSLSDEQKKALSPDGPKNTLDPQTYDGYTVGDEVSMKGKFTSTALGHPVP